MIELMNSLGATSGQDGVSLAEGDPGFLSAGGSEKSSETFAKRAASSIIVLHCPVLNLLAEAYNMSGYSTSLTSSNLTKCVSDQFITEHKHDTFYCELWIKNLQQPAAGE